MAEKYLKNPQKYCERITTLLEQNSDEWLVVWKAALPELSNLQANEVSVINTLLKPVESAFKSKDSKLRVQAFDCWSQFIIHCENAKVSDKLCSVLLIPLLAHNHSIYIVLSAKLKTWHTLVDTSLISKPNIMKKSIPSILKFLYGPHNLETACNFSALSETCGQLYHKIMMKCAPFDESIDLIFSYLEKAIPPLSNMENTLKLARLIWSDAIKLISEKEWPKNQFAYLMRTLENLISDNKNDGFQLISSFLSVLINIFGSFPSDRLTPHLNLAIRCLFHPPINSQVIMNIMNGLVKLSKKPSFFFHQLDLVLSSIVDSDRNDIDTLWITVSSCYKKWAKNNSINDSNLPNHDYSTACKILLFPFTSLSHLSDDTEKFNAIMKEWKLCYEQCAISAGNYCEKFIESLTNKLKIGIDDISNRNAPLIPSLKMAAAMCNAILTLIKYSDAFSHIKPVLLRISQCFPDSKKLSDPDIKPFATKYIVTVLSYVKLFPAHSDDFYSIIEMFGNSVPKDLEGKKKFLNELPINTETAQNTESKIDEVGESSVKLSTPLGKTKLRTSFLERLSPATRKSDVVENQLRSPVTPTSKSNDDVQFIEIKPKAKNSPMTQHQKEKAEAKGYIPALYQDLSQSQSQSESVSLLENKKLNEKIDADLFEENANMASVNDNSEIVPSSLSFRTILTAAEKSPFTAKKSLFKTSTDTDANTVIEIEIDSAKQPNIPNDESSTKKPAKRKNSFEKERPIEPAVEVTPVKRSKRLSNKIKQCETKSRTSPQVGRSRRSYQSGDRENKEIINLTDCDSQNVFLPASKKPPVVSSPLNSLMNVKDDETGGKTKRKSLRARKTLTPVQSSITTRKRRSSAVPEGVINPKKNLFTDSPDENNADDENAKIIVIEGTDEKIEENGRDIGENVSKTDDCSETKEITVLKSTTRQISPDKLNDSVMIVEEIVNEVISINDSDCQSDKTIGNLPSLPECQAAIKNDASDESTFFEGSNDAKAETESVNQNVSVIRSTNETTRSPEIITSLEDADKTNTDVGSVSILENVANEFVSILDSSEVEKMDDTRGDNVIEECADNGANLDEKNDDVACPNEVSISPLHGNSRGSQIMKLAYGMNQPGLKQKVYSNIGKTRPPQGAPILQYCQRSSRIMRNLQFEDANASTSSKIVTTPVVEKYTYTPKECTSPGILKKPDARNNLSPKSPKFVNFADELTDTREFINDDDIDTDSLMSTGDKASNLINDEGKSQEVLYSPLRNCRDNIKDAIPFIFPSSCADTALDHFQRLGICTVGQLAGMNTITANSIPAGDNRVQRLRQALKKYDDSIEAEYENKGLRKPSARRRILRLTVDENYYEISSIIDLLEPDETDNATEISNSTETPVAESNAVSENSIVEQSSPVETAQCMEDCSENVNVTESPVKDVAKDVEKDISMEKVEQTEDKENVDPSCALMMEISEPCESNKQPGDVNESTDYVCTDNENVYNQDSSDRRSVTVKNIHRFSTLIDIDTKTTETTGEKSEASNSTKESVLDVENEISQMPESSQIVENQSVPDEAMPGVQEPPDLETVTAQYPEMWREVMQIIYPCPASSVELAREYMIGLFRKINEKAKKYDLEFCVKSNK